MAFSETLNILRAEETGSLLIEPLSEGSVAMRVSNVIATNEERYRVPKIVTDPTAGWVDENEDIPESEVAGDNVTTRPAKVAGLVFLPNELVEDSDPNAAALAGRRLVQGIISKVDEAFFAQAPGEEDPDYEDERPGGLESIDDADLSVIDADPTNLDSYIDALAEAESQGTTPDSWAMHPTTARALAKIKAGTGSNALLLGQGAENGVGRRVLGVPVITSPHIVPGHVWGLPKERSLVVVRKDFELATSQHYAFRKDQTAVRVIARIGFLFPSTRSLVKIAQGA